MHWELITSKETGLEAAGHIEPADYFFSKAFTPK